MAPDPTPWSVEAARHGTAGPLTLLLHGQGAAGLVWDGVVQASQRAGHARRFLVPDLPGHGRSGRLRRYTPGAYAAAIADLLPVDEPVVAVGHSLGGLIALTLATGHYGVEVSEVVCLAVKVRWSEEEAAARARRAARPPRRHPDREVARAAFARAAGVEGTASGAALDVGVATDGDGYVLAHDPATAIEPPVPEAQIAAIRRSVSCPVRLVCGDADPMVAPDDMARMGGSVDVLPGAGHNVHVDDPVLVADVVAQAGRR